MKRVNPSLAIEPLEPESQQNKSKDKISKEPSSKNALQTTSTFVNKGGQASQDENTPSRSFTVVQKGQLSGANSVELQKAKIELDKYKQESANAQKEYAKCIVRLEERIDELIEQHQKAFFQQERNHKVQLETASTETSRRELELSSEIQLLMKELKGQKIQNELAYNQV